MSRVRENRMHGSMGGSWNRGVATATRTWAPGENAGAVRRGLPPFNVTAPAPYPTATGTGRRGRFGAVCMGRCRIMRTTVFRPGLGPTIPDHPLPSQCVMT